MGKSSRKSIAAALSKSESPGEEDTSGPVVAQDHEHATPDHEGLVVLNSRRPPQERSPRSKSRREIEPNKMGEQIGAQLRTLYNDMLEQPVPERFLELLNKLESDTICSPRSKAPGER